MGAIQHSSTPMLQQVLDALPAHTYIDRAMNSNTNTATSGRLLGLLLLTARVAVGLGRLL